MGSKIEQARRRKELSRKLITLGEGIFEFAFDAALWYSVFFVALGETRKGDPASVYRAGHKTDKFLEEVNYRAIKNALITATRRELVKIVKRGAVPEITEAGKKRLTSIIPVYDEKRVWDGQLHLVTYDVPERKRYDRDVLREKIRRLGCAKLQESVWITPYDPIDTLRTFIEDEGLTGTVIISKMGKDSSIGEEDLITLLVRLYRLDALNKRYAFWLGVYNKGILDQGGLVSYLAILKDDPQLPFALLPRWWKGDKAYSKVKPLLSILLTALRPQTS